MASKEELKAKLALKLEQFRTKRNAQPKSVMSRSQMLEQRQQKKEKRKERERQEALENAKKEEEEILKQAASNLSVIDDIALEDKPKKKERQQFNKIIVGKTSEYDPSKGALKPLKRKKQFNPKNKLASLEAKKRKLEEMDPEQVCDFNRFVSFENKIKHTFLLKAVC